MGRKVMEQLPNRASDAGEAYAFSLPTRDDWRACIDEARDYLATAQTYTRDEAMEEAKMQLALLASAEDFIEEARALLRSRLRKLDALRKMQAMLTDQASAEAYASLAAVRTLAEVRAAVENGGRA
jgi:hypothetical protein